jgi:hypothetical protein
MEAETVAQAGAGRRPGKPPADDAAWRERMSKLCSRCGQSTLDANGVCVACGSTAKRKPTSGDEHRQCRPTHNTAKYSTAHDYASASVTHHEALRIADARSLANPAVLVHRDVAPSNVGAGGDARRGGAHRCLAVAPRAPLRASWSRSATSTPPPRLKAL